MFALCRRRRRPRDRAVAEAAILYKILLFMPSPDKVYGGAER